MRHGCCKIDKYRMIIVGGSNAQEKFLSSGAIYDTRTEQWKTLPNDMPEALADCSVVAKGDYVYVIGGKGALVYAVANTVYRLSLKTYQWTTIAPMVSSRARFAAVLKGDYIYVFGGMSRRLQPAWLASAERYSIADNIWEALSDMAGGRVEHCAVASSSSSSSSSSGSSDIYIVGGSVLFKHAVSLERFDTASLCWKRDRNLIDMPEGRTNAAAVMLQDRYLVVIGGCGENVIAAANCYIYDCIFNRWARRSVSIDMNTALGNHTAVALGGKITVAGGQNDLKPLTSMEYIDTRDLLNFVPLVYPLPTFYFNQIIQTGKAYYDANGDVDSDDADVEDLRAIWQIRNSSRGTITNLIHLLVMNTYRVASLYQKYN